jgi:glycosyltransferase involved in cell wall biosynthesis
MKVSIVTIAFNASATIAETIESVLSQDYDDIEYIVVDGDSKDGTQEIVTTYGSRIHTFISEPDEGIYDAMNKGIELATGELVGVLNADDAYAHSAAITHVVHAIKASSADAAYADLQYVDAANPGKVIRHWVAGAYERKKFLTGWMPPHPTFFLKRAHYEAFGRFNTDMRISADYELMLRMLFKNRLDPVYIPEVLVKMKAGGASNASLKNRLLANSEDRKAWKINDLKPGKLTFVMKPLGKIGQFFRR